MQARRDPPSRRCSSSSERPSPRTFPSWMTFPRAAFAGSAIFCQWSCETSPAPRSSATASSPPALPPVARRALWINRGIVTWLLVVTRTVLLLHATIRQFGSDRPGASAMPAHAVVVSPSSAVKYAQSGWWNTRALTLASGSIIMPSVSCTPMSSGRSNWNCPAGRRDWDRQGSRSCSACRDTSR